MSNKKIIITGGAGFVGTNLIKYLLKKLIKYLYKKENKG